MAYLGVTPTQEFSSVAKQSVTGDGSVSYTLNKGVSDANDLAVFVNDVRQEPGVAYTASGNTITFTANLESTDDCYILHIGRTFSSAESPGIEDKATQKVLTITTDGHLVPTANVTYDLGTSDLRFRDIYLSGSSIELGSQSITSNATHVAIGGLAFSNTISGDGSDLTNLNASELASGTIPDARFPATLPSANGTNLTSLNADELSSGTVPDARFPATLPSANGTNLTSLNATEITTGTIDNARLPSNINVANDLTIAGDLIVNGNTTTIAANELKIEDSLIQLASNNETSDTVDIGFVGHYYDGSTQVHTGFFRDASDEQYYLFKGYEDASFDTDTPPATIDRTANTFSLANLVVNKLGVGTSPTGSDLHIDSNGTNTTLRFQNSTLDDGYIQFTNAGKMRTYTSGIIQTTLDSSGNFGIGTDNPTGFAGYTSLDINNATNGSLIDLSQGDTMKGRLIATSSTMAIETASGVPIIFQPAGTEHMRIDSNGRVGIGTASPAAELHINNSSGATFTRISGTTAAVLDMYGGATNTKPIRFFGGSDTEAYAGIRALDNNAGLSFETGVGGSTAATERMRIDSSGNVGIGTDSPIGPLSVVAASGGGAIDVFGRSADGLGWISFKTNNGSSSHSLIGTPIADTLAFYTNGFNERMRIDSAGDIYIGNNGSATTRVVEISGTNTGTNPAANGHLAGELRFRNVSATDNNLSAISFYNSNNAVDSRIAGIHKSHSLRYGEIAFLTHNGSALGEKMRIDSSGNLGLGTTAPSSYGGGFVVDDLGINILTASVSSPGTNKLSWWSDSNGISQNAYISVVNDGATTNTGEMVFYTKNASATLAERMRIDASGNVGIGTNNPTSKFQINNNGATTQTFYVDVGNYNNTQTLFEHTGSNTPVPFKIAKSGYTGNSQAFGILHLHMNHSTVGGGSNMHFTLLDSASNVTEYGGLGAVIEDSTSGTEDGALVFYTTQNSNTRQERMRINSSGNVGIGTNNPTSKLEIAGGDVKIPATNSFGWRYNSGDSNMYNYIYNDYTATGGIKYRSGIWTSSTTIECHDFQTYVNSAWTSRLKILQNGEIYVGGHIHFGSDVTSGNNDQGPRIRYGSDSSSYGSIRFYQAGTNVSTIHSFATGWQGGSLAGSSAGAINLSGSTGVTFGPWNALDGYIDTSGNMWIAGTLTEASAMRYKENIRDLEYNNIISYLKPKIYNRIGEKNDEIGLIAEDVEVLDKNLVTYNDEGKVDGIHYTRLVPHLIAHIQKLEERLAVLENG